MSKNWYPVVDYLECAECGTCVEFCTHGVYDKAKAPTPVVVHPDGCIEGCHGCEEECPNNTIQYVGDVKGDSECGCNCGCGGSCE